MRFGVSASHHRRRIYGDVKVSGGGGTTTFDPSNHGPHIVLSNGNLTATSNTLGSSYEIARSIASHSTGKFYSEKTINANPSTGNGLCVGITDATTSLTTYLGSDLHSIGYFGGGSVDLNNVTITTIQSWTATNVVQEAVDLGAQLIWWNVNNGNWNNSGTANPATGVGGISISTLTAGAYYSAICYQTTAGNQITGNWGAASPGYTYSAPSGYGNW